MPAKGHHASTVKYPEGFEEHGVYRFRTRDGRQRYAREHLLTFLTRDKFNGDLIFNARPFAGTQTFDRRTKFLHVEKVGTSVGRDDPRHYMNKVIHSDWV